MSGIWDQLVDCICRPPRDTYEEAEVFGGNEKRFDTRVGDERILGYREDLVVHNKKGQKLHCSHFFPQQNHGKDGKLPCVVYCHCNSGSKRDGEEALAVLIPQGVSVFTFDFAGSGLSDGDWVTLGSNEVEDLEAVVAHLRGTNLVSTLGLWGRSMGAVTALMFSQRDPSVAGMVLDSPFSRLTDLMLEIVEEQRLPIPKAVTKLVLGAMRKSVKKRADFDINTVAPLDLVNESFIPTLFGHGEEDTFIKIHHSLRLHGAYAGDKNLIRFPGDHNSRRPQFFYASVGIFFLNSLRLHDVMARDPAAVREALRAAPSNRAPQPSPQRREHAQDAPPQLLAGLSPEQEASLAGAEVDASGQLVWPDEEEELRMALALSLQDVPPSAASDQTPSRPAPPTQDAQRSRPAAAEEEEDDDNDAQLREAIARSLLDSQLNSLVPPVAPTAPHAPPGMLQAPPGMLQAQGPVAAKPAVPSATAPQLAPGTDAK